MKFSLLSSIVLFLSLWRGVLGFGVPQAFISSHATTNGATLPSSVASMISDGGMAATPSLSVSSTASSLSSFLIIAEGDGGIVDIIRNIAIAITAVVFLFAGITLLTASVLIPAAAKELEKECLELSPELWEEYQAKLEPGQTIDQRPELMQELGTKLQPMLDAKIARAQAGQDTTPSNTGQWDDTGASFVDAEIVVEDKDEKDNKSS